MKCCENGRKMNEFGEEDVKEVSVDENGNCIEDISVVWVDCCYRGVESFSGGWSWYVCVECGKLYVIFLNFFWYK